MVSLNVVDAVLFLMVLQEEDVEGLGILIWSGFFWLLILGKG